MTTPRPLPLLVGAAAEPYRRFIEDEVDAAVSGDRQVPRNPTLWAGCAGEALALHQLGRFLERDVSRPVAALVQQAVAQINEGVIGDGLFMGLGGVGLVLARLEEDLPFDCTDVLSAVDDHVAGRLADDSAGSYELFSGRAGDALYALERSDQPRLRASLGAFLGWLESRAAHGASGACWTTLPVAEFSASFGLPPDRPVAVLGMAHGLAGLLPILGRMVRAGIEPDRAQSLLDATWRFIRHAGAGTGPFRFPAGVCDGRPFGAGAFAWCKGDPGILAAAAAAFGSAAPELGPLAEAAFARARRPGPESGGLGYGRLGVALAFAGALSTEPPAWCSLMGLGAELFTRT